MAHCGFPYQFRPKLVSSPDELWEKFIQYKEWAHANPWIKKEAIKTGDLAGEIIDIPHERPLTGYEFAAFLGMSYQGWLNYVNGQGHEAYFDISARIKAEMTSQRISGGLVEAYNANLVARLDGLQEHSAIETTFEPIIIQSPDGKNLTELRVGTKNADYQTT